MDVDRLQFAESREQGYLSEPARELIKIVRSFNWGGKVAPLKKRA